jgi:uncharacterized SAM-binding protein YcdF (DUF218 family)
MEKFLHHVLYYIIYIDMWMVWLLLLGTLLLMTRWWRTGRVIIVFVAFLFILIGVSPIPIRMAANLEDRFPKPHIVPSNVVGAILLGGSFNRAVSVERGLVSYLITCSRIIEFAQLAHQNPNLRLVFTGGGVPISKGQSESALLRKVYQEMGIDTSRILFEDKSKDTIQNAKFSFELVKPQKGETWLLVTSALHMPRAMGLFRKAGWNVLAYPVDYHSKFSDHSLLVNSDLLLGLTAWRYSVREWSGMIKNYLSRQSDELYPHP